MPHFILFSRDIALLSLVFQCCMDNNKFIFFFHYTPHMHALWIVPSAQYQFACKQLTNRDPDPSTHQNHTHPPGPEPLPLSANLAPRARLDSACSGVSVASRQGPKDKGDRAPLSEQVRLARRNKDRKKRKMKRQEQTANKRENKDPGQLADAKSQEEVAESQPVCSGEPKKTTTTTTTQPPTHPPTHQPTHQPTHPQTPPPPAYDPPVRSTVR